ncbi:MAG: hypothetical protein IJG85_05290 [Eubacteriaceae bacterium]|nr:hypothetical protein [Eubacteriaceae bacterium]
MVVYERIDVNPKFIRYRYYPENDRNYAPGTIIVDMENKVINVEEPAEADIYFVHSAEELLMMREAMDAERAEQGLPELSDAEFPFEDDVACYIYATHAIAELSKKYRCR